MTPISPGEQVDASEVINVTGLDGVVRQFRRRKMGMWLFKNGKPSNDFVQGALKVATVGKAVILFLAALCGMMWTLNETVILPQQKRMIEGVVAEQLAPLAKRLDADEQLFRDHLLDVERQRSFFPTRTELKDDMTEIKAMIQRLEDRR